MKETFEMVAKTFQGLEDVLAEELRGLGALNVMPGKRMVAFEGDKELLYKANLCCRTALRILKPFYKFSAKDPDSLYEHVKEYDWSSLLTIDKTFQIDTVAYSDEFSHSRFVTYRVKDAIVDWFKDRYGADKRPGVRLIDADVMINVHISGTDVTLSLDSSGESLHKRGYRVAQTEAPINEVLAAGIILKTGWRGDCPFVDPMCGSGTFLIEAALIAANINPGIYRKGFAFEKWKDFDADLFDRIYNDDSNEREVSFPIIGADISPKAIEIAKKNVAGAGLNKYVKLEVKPISRWDEAPEAPGVVVTNPPYGERISAPDMDALYAMIGNRLKNVFTGYNAWIIGYRDEYFSRIGLAPSQKIAMLNGSLECELREYVIFEGDKKSYLSAGGKLKNRKGEDLEREAIGPKKFRDRDDKPRKGGKFGDRNDRGGKFSDRNDRGGKFGDRNDRGGKFSDRNDRGGKFNDRNDRGGKFGDRNDRGGKFNDRNDRGGKFGDRNDRGGKFNDRPARPAADTASPDNPLAQRRNPNALKALQNRTPSLPAQEGPIMRSRGWKKKS